MRNIILHHRSVRPAAATPTASTINALVGTFSATGSGTVSSGFPLKPGQLTDAQFTAKQLLVRVGGTEKAIYAEALRGRHPDNSIRSVLIQFVHNTTSTAVWEDATVEVAGTVRTTVDITETPRTMAIMEAGRCILPKDRSQTKDCWVAFRPVLDASLETSTHTGLLVDQFNNRFAVWKGNGVTLGNYQSTYEHVRALVIRWQAHGSTTAGARDWYWESIQRSYYHARNYLLTTNGAGVWSPEVNPDSWTCTGGALPAEQHSQTQWGLLAAYYLTGAKPFRNLLGVRQGWATAGNSTSVLTGTLGDTHAISAIYLPRFNLRHLNAVMMAAAADLTEPFSGGFGQGRSLGGSAAATELPWYTDAHNTHRFASGYRADFRGADDATTDGPANGAPANGDFPNFQALLTASAYLDWYLNVEKSATVAGYIKKNIDIVFDNNLVNISSGGWNYAAGARKGWDYWCGATPGLAAGPDPYTLSMAADCLAFLKAYDGAAKYATNLAIAMQAYNVEGDGASGGSLGGIGNLSWGNATSNWGECGKLFGEIFGYAGSAPYFDVAGIPAGLPLSIRSPTTQY